MRNIKKLALSEPYREYIRLLLDLHSLESLDETEGDQADLIRDSMDAPWQLLSKTERDRITGLSADLYMITDPPPMLVPTTNSPQVAVEAVEMRNAGRWDDALTLIRNCCTYFEPALIAYIRGSIWMDAGDDPVASVFFKHASKLSPDNENYRTMYMESLSSADPSKAYNLAAEMLRNPDKHSSQSIVKAAEISFSQSKIMSETDSQSLLAVIAGILAKVIPKLTDGLAIKGAVYAKAVSLAAMCQDGLGNSAEALELYNKGIKETPNNDALLTARGILLYGQDASAIEDFRMAIRLDSPLVWPSFFLAHQCLITGQYEECLERSIRGLQFESANSVKAAFYEWIAIAHSELGHAKFQVRQAFESAVRLDSQNDQIQSNFAAFESALVSSSITNIWKKPSKLKIQQLGHQSQRRSLTVAA